MSDTELPELTPAQARAILDERRHPFRPQPPSIDERLMNVQIPIYMQKFKLPTKTHYQSKHHIEKYVALVGLPSQSWGRTLRLAGVIKD